MLKGIDHIGIVVEDISVSLPLFRDIMGLELLGTEVISEDDVKVASLAVGESRIELIEPLKEETPAFRFLKKKGESIHHVALLVHNLEETLKRLRKAGLDIIDDRSQTGAMGRKVAFIHPRSCHGILVELCEKQKT